MSKTATAALEPFKVTAIEAVLSATAVALAVAFVGNPIVAGMLLAIGCSLAWLVRPDIALKLAFFLGGIPLTVFYQFDGDFEGLTRPLFASLGGTTPDGLRLVLTSGILAVLCVSSPVSRRLLVRFWPYCLFLVFAALSLVYTDARAEGLRLVLKIAYPVLLVVVAAQFVHTREQIESVLNWWVAGGVACSILGALLLVFTGTNFMYQGGEFRYSPGFVHPNPFAFYMFALFFYCYSRWRVHKTAYFIPLMVLFAAQSILSGTRAAWLCFPMGLVLYELMGSESRRKWLKISAYVLVPVIALNIVLWHSTTLQERVFRTTDLDPNASIVELLSDVHTSGRLAVWAIGFDEYLSHNKFIGQGIGSNDRLYAGMFQFNVGTVAHNEYLRVLYDTGAIGLLLFLLANYSMFRTAHRLRSHINPDVLLYRRIGYILFVVYLFVAITNNPLEYYVVFSQYIFFILAAAMVLAGKDRNHVVAPSQ